MPGWLECPNFCGLFTSQVTWCYTWNLTGKGWILIKILSYKLFDYLLSKIIFQPRRTVTIMVTTEYDDVHHDLLAMLRKCLVLFSSMKSLFWRRNLNKWSLTWQPLQSIAKRYFKVPLRSNYWYSFFYIFVYNMTFLHILPNFNPLRTLEVALFGLLFSRIYRRH